MMQMQQAFTDSIPFTIYLYSIYHLLHLSRNIKKLNEYQSGIYSSKNYGQWLADKKTQNSEQFKILQAHSLYSHLQYMTELNRDAEVTVSVSANIVPKTSISNEGQWTRIHQQQFINHTRKPCYRKDDRAMRPTYTYKLFTLILFTLTVTILCADFDSERI